MQCFICMGGSLWLALCLLIKGSLCFVNLSKFGRRFSCAQKLLLISKTPCLFITSFSCGQGGARRSHVEIESGKNCKANIYMSIKFSENPYMWFQHICLFFTINNDVKMWEANYSKSLAHSCKTNVLILFKYHLKNKKCRWRPKNSFTKI